ncbi:MAG: M50 family metallopeptidase [Planctomycetota bacterium]|nr:M50 family metallopeptidase [Planctomycetota bacterium]
MPNQVSAPPPDARAGRMTRTEALRKWLVVLGATVLVFNSTEIVHECGHLLAAVATGGRAHGISMTPVGWSHAASEGGEVHAVLWGGFATEAAVGLAILGLIWTFWKRLSAMGLLVGIVSLLGTGIYMIVGTVAACPKVSGHQPISGALPKFSPS